MFIVNQGGEIINLYCISLIKIDGKSIVAYPKIENMGYYLYEGSDENVLKYVYKEIMISIEKEVKILYISDVIWKHFEKNGNH